MKVVILCGGYGTRIRDVSETLPKPMINIGRFPILWHIMKYYAQFGHTEFVLCLGYKSTVIKDFFLNYRAHTSDITVALGDTRNIKYEYSEDPVDWSVTLAETGLDAMTGARIKRIERYIGNDENFLLTYGDGVGNIDIGKLVAFHQQHGKVLTVTGVKPPGRFGEISSDSKGRVLGFHEKPNASGGCISGGFFVCKREIFKYIKNQDSVMFEAEPIQDLVKDKQLMVYEHPDFWQPMDTHRDYLLLNDMFERGKAPWVIWK